MHVLVNRTSCPRKSWRTCSSRTGRSFQWPSHPWTHPLPERTRGLRQPMEPMEQWHSCMTISQWAASNWWSATRHTHCGPCQRRIQNVSQNELLSLCPPLLFSSSFAHCAKCLFQLHLFPVSLSISRNKHQGKRNLTIVQNTECYWRMYQCYWRM